MLPFHPRKAICRPNIGAPLNSDWGWRQPAVMKVDPPVGKPANFRCVSHH